MNTGLQVFMKKRLERNFKYYLLISSKTIHSPLPLPCLMYFNNPFCFKSWTHSFMYDFPTSNTSYKSFSRLLGLFRKYSSISLHIASFLQGIFLTQELNPGLLHCKQILYQRNHKGSPRILKWVAYPFFRYLPSPGIELHSPAMQADSLPTELLGKPCK